MDINKRTVFYMSILLVVTMVSFILAKGDSPIVSNIFLALFTSAFIVICTSLTNYWHEKEVFLNNLFLNGVSLNLNLEEIKQLIACLGEDFDLKKVVQNLNMRADVIRNRAAPLILKQYLPFWKGSREAELVARVCFLYQEMRETVLQKIVEIEIAKGEIKILQLQLQLQEVMYQNLQNQNKQMQFLQDKLLRKRAEAKKLLGSLASKTGEVQTNYICTMNNLYCIFESWVPWMEVIKADKERISKTMPDFVKNVMCKDNDSVV